MAEGEDEGVKGRGDCDEEEDEEEGRACMWGREGIGVKDLQIQRE